MREILRDLIHLTRSRLEQTRGNLRLGGRPAIIRLILIVIGGAILVQGIYWGSYRFLYWIISRTDFVGGILTGVFVDYLLLIAMATAAFFAQNALGLLLRECGDAQTWWWLGAAGLIVVAGAGVLQLLGHGRVL